LVRASATVKYAVTSTAGAARSATGMVSTVATDERATSVRNAGSRPPSVSTAGVDAPRELTQLARGGGELVGRLVEQPGRFLRLALNARARQPQVERQADEPLLGPVVEVALEPPARLVGRLHDARPGRLQFGLLALALGDVAEVAREGRRPRHVDAGDRELDRELRPVRAHYR
jgi:hypothetical protein